MSGTHHRKASKLSVCLSVLHETFTTLALTFSPLSHSLKQEADKPAQDAAVATRPQRLPSTHKQPLVWVDLEMTGASVHDAANSILAPVYTFLP